MNRQKRGNLCFFQNTEKDGFACVSSRRRKRRGPHEIQPDSCLWLPIETPPNNCITSDGAISIRKYHCCNHVCMHRCLSAVRIREQKSQRIFWLILRTSRPVNSSHCICFNPIFLWSHSIYLHPIAFTFSKTVASTHLRHYTPKASISNLSPKLQYPIYPKSFNNQFIPKAAHLKIV